MSVEALMTAAVGAFFGAAGWLLVGLFMTRRQVERQSRNAARAVYFELTMNAIDIDVAEQHLVFQPLRRASFDSLLPELATWLHAEELETIVKAYMSHAGYEQAQRDDKLPSPCARRSYIKCLSSTARRSSFFCDDRSRRAMPRVCPSTNAVGSSHTEPTRAAAGARNA